MFHLTEVQLNFAGNGTSHYIPSQVTSQDDSTQDKLSKEPLSIKFPSHPLFPCISNHVKKVDADRATRWEITSKERKAIQTSIPIVPQGTRGTVTKGYWGIGYNRISHLTSAGTWREVSWYGEKWIESETIHIDHVIPATQNNFVPSDSPMPKPDKPIYHHSHVVREYSKPKGRSGTNTPKAIGKRRFYGFYEDEVLAKTRARQARKEQPNHTVSILTGKQPAGNYGSIDRVGWFVVSKPKTSRKSKGKAEKTLTIEQVESMWNAEPEDDDDDTSIDLTSTSRPSHLIHEVCLRMVRSRMVYEKSSSSRLAGGKTLQGSQWYDPSTRLVQDLISELVTDVWAWYAGHDTSKQGKDLLADLSATKVSTFSHLIDDDVEKLTKYYERGQVLRLIDSTPTETTVCHFHLAIQDESHMLAHVARLFFSRCHSRVINKYIASVTDEHRGTWTDTRYYTDSFPLCSTSQIKAIHTQLTLSLHESKSPKLPKFEHEHLGDGNIRLYDARLMVSDSNIDIDVESETITLHNVYECYADSEQRLASNQLRLRESLVVQSLNPDSQWYNVMGYTLAYELRKAIENKLSKTERWLVALILKGLTNKEISASLYNTMIEHGHSVTRKECQHLVSSARLELAHEIQDRVLDLVSPSQECRDKIKVHHDQIGKKRMAKILRMAEDAGLVMDTLDDTVVHNLVSTVLPQSMYSTGPAMEDASLSFGYGETV